VSPRYVRCLFVIRSHSRSRSSGAESAERMKTRTRNENDRIRGAVFDILKTDSRRTTHSDQSRFAAGHGPIAHPSCHAPHAANRPRRRTRFWPKKTFARHVSKVMKASVALKYVFSFSLAHALIAGEKTSLNLPAIPPIEFAPKAKLLVVDVPLKPLPKSGLCPPRSFNSGLMWQCGGILILKARPPLDPIRHYVTHIETWNVLKYGGLNER